MGVEDCSESGREGEKSEMKFLPPLYHSKPFIFMKIHFKVSEAIEEIDAALFSGDSFFLIENLEELERILERWEKRKNEIKTFLSEE